MSEHKARCDTQTIVTCPFCYGFLGARFRDHVCQPMKDAFPNTEERREEKRRITHETKARQVRRKEFFLEKDLKGQFFTREQVIQILGQFEIRSITNDKYPVRYDFPVGFENKPFVLPPPGFQMFYPYQPTTPAVVHPPTTVDNSTTVPFSVCASTATVPFCSSVPTTSTVSTVKDFTDNTQTSRSRQLISLDLPSSPEIDVEDIDADLLANGVQSNSTGRNVTRFLTFAETKDDDANVTSPRKRPLESSSEVEERRSTKKLRSSSSSADTSPSTRTPKHHKNFKEGTLRKKMSDAGAYSIPREFYDLPLMSGFMKYWTVDQKKPDQLARNHASNVAKMLFHMNNNQVVVDTKTITRDSLRGYYSWARELLTAQTVSNHNKSFKHFLKYILHHTEIMTKDRTEFERISSLNEFLMTLGAGFERESKQNYRIQKSTETVNPPTPAEVVVIVEKCRDRARAILESYKKKSVATMLQRDVAFLNRYLSALVCLGMGHRVGVMINLRAAEFNKCLNEDVVYESNGHNFRLISVAEHKTAEQYCAWICLDEDDWKLFCDYNKYIREPIVTARSENEYFLVMWDGGHFVKVADGISKLQKEAGVPQITSTMARKSFETYHSNLSEKTQKNMAACMFLAHSEGMRDKRHRSADKECVIDATIKIRALSKYYTDRGQDVRPNEGQLAMPTVQTSQPTSPLKKKTSSSTDTNEVTPSSMLQRIEEIVDTIIKDREPIASATKLPQPTWIVCNFNVSTHIANKISDKLRYRKSQCISNIVASKVMAAEAKRLHKKASDIRDAPVLPPYATLLKYSDGVNVKLDMVKRAIRKRIVENSERQQDENTLSHLKKSQD